MKKIKFLVHSFFKGIIIILFLVIGNYLFIEFYALPYTHKPEDIQETYAIGLLLGTSKYSAGKQQNPFYDYRIKTAADLYHGGKIRSILISGDRASKYYDETQTMKRDLIKAGIPPQKIFLDTAGYRTYDSMIRANKIFGLKKFLVISQDFHIKRAIFIGRMKGLDVEGAKTPEIKGTKKYKILIREVGARLKATWDLINGTQPKKLGKKQRIL